LPQGSKIALGSAVGFTTAWTTVQAVVYDSSALEQLLVPNLCVCWFMFSWIVRNDVGNFNIFYCHDC